MRPFVSLAALAVCMSTGAAHGQLLVLGRSPAATCYDHALHERHDMASIRDCDIALQDIRVTRRDRAATLVNRGILNIHRGRGSDAIADFDSAQRMDVIPNAVLAVNRSSALIRLGRYQEAVAEADIAIRGRGESEADAWFNRAVALEALGELAAAYDSYRQARHLRPGWDQPEAELARFSINSR
ncbi:tetratricopeptide repeat protein [Maricaulis sp.]|uniref:tetratricopeptide repeat protein n=1 Tax=Maricaulis sp. TaxID=1486257 RepID=UPI0025B8B99B|nr:tetratricopeptide repeat protein [Maricaulis sp.]